MNYDEKISVAVGLIGSYNEFLKSNNIDTSLGIDEFKKNLFLIGATNVETLSDLSFEDILSCFEHSGSENSKIKPLLLAKQIAKGFRSEGDKLGRQISERKVDKLTLEELFDLIDFDYAESNINKKLDELSKGKKFVVFNSDDYSSVNKDVSLQLLKELMSTNLPSRDSVTIDNKVYKTHTLLEAISYNKFLKENPIFKDTPLRTDETCHLTNRTWKNIDDSIRKLIRLVVSVENVKITKDKAHDLIDLAEKGFDAVAVRYTDAAIRYKELEQEGKLPSLKMKLNSSNYSNTNMLKNGKVVN